MKSVPVEDLRNVGSTIAQRLRDVGIRTRADLEKAGPVAAYRRICAQEPGITIPVCYYLYSLEGALRDRHWDAIGEETKRRLLREVADIRASRRKRSAGGSNGPR